MAVLLCLKVTLGLWLFDGTLTSFARAMALAQVLALPLYLWVYHRYLAIGPMLWLRTIAPVLALTLLLGGAMWLLGQLLPRTPHLLTIVVHGVVAAPIWLGLVRVFKLPLMDELRNLGQRLRRPARG